MIQQVTVYCASSPKVAKEYFEITDAVARIMAKSGITVMFGGGGKGLMGQLADSVLAENGKIIGVMPHFMKEVEWQHPQVQELILTKDMAERKAKFLETADALLTLPGGCGTLEELLEAITLKRLGKFTKPIIIFNHNGFYDPLIAMLEKCIAQQFMREVHRDIWTVITKAEELIPAIENAPTWDESAIRFAGV